jgi:hypothetical protein
VISASSELLLDIASFCQKRLDIPKDINITISECCLKEDNTWGWCYDDSDNDYDIELEATLDPVDLAETLCHEMVHIKQYSKGQEADEDEAYHLEGILYNEWKEKQHGKRI